MPQFIHEEASVQTDGNHTAHLQWLLTPFQESPDLYSPSVTNSANASFTVYYSFFSHIRGENKYLSDFPEEAVREDEKIIVS
ncbi:MAG: hypothetical protein E7110_02305 [Bacteroidales bacterium]|nr:hypothetical protein [Bacteroidales bacterium]